MTTDTIPFTGTFRADPVHSSFQFEVAHMGGATFRASFEAVEARVVARAEGSVRFEGSARVDSISIRNPPEFRDHVVYGADFFDGHNHPEIRFVGEEAELAGDGSFRGRGLLTIRGITKPVEASGTYRPVIADPFGSLRTAVELTATVDRRDWGMDWQMPLPAGGDVLGYEVVLSAHIELVKEQ